MGPAMPHTTIVSPSRSSPFTSTTSMVVPRPSIVLTSRIVACVCGVNMSRWLMSCCVSCTSSMSRSGTPSPVKAEVGTTLTLRLKLSFS